MNENASTPGSSIIPTVRYRDVPAAVTWLQEAFGFMPHRLVKDTKGAVLYAELTFGTGMVMVAPIQESPFGKLMVQPDEIGGVETQICYLFVPDTKAHYTRAKAAGAEIVLDIEVERDGRRGYSCRDLEGHVWNFGTHNPWSAKAGAAADRQPRRSRKALAACLMLLAAAGGLYMHEPARTAARDLALVLLDKVSSSIESAQANQTADRDDASVRELRDQLFNEQLARTAAEKQVQEIREQLAQERRAREAAEGAIKTAVAPVQQPPMQNSNPATDNELARLRKALQAANEQLAQAQKAKDAAERDAKTAREQFAQLQATREEAGTTAKSLRELAIRERRARIAAERTLRKAKESPYTPYPLN